MTKLFFLLLAAILLMPVACVDQDFDQPPPGGNDPNLAVNISIAEIKATHTLGTYEEITEDWTFTGLVISDDEEGNFFKQLVIQDSTGGIEMRIEMSNLANVYPVGRKVYVKVKGLWIGDYNGLIQLGAGVGTDDDGDPELIRIPESVLSQYIVTATYGNTVTPKIMTIDQLEESDVSTLIQLDAVQFIAADAGQIYADAVLEETLNREIEDCAKRRLIVRTSGFATFAGDSTPLLNGSIVGVLSIFGDVYQLTIRDLDDVDMTGDRCGSSATSFSISSIRQLFTGSPVAAPSGTIKGVVISDYTSGSIHGLSLYVQDATAGIVLRFADDHSFALGAEILVDMSGGTLDEFHGLLQVNGLELSSTSVVGNPGDFTPRQATVLEVLTNAQAWESTLVEISNVTLSGNSIYDLSVTVTDASGAMIMFTRSDATFSQTALPSGEVTVTAIVSEYDTPQLIIRNTNDVTGGGGGGDEFDIAEIRQLFAGGTTAAPSGTIQGVVISDLNSMSVHEKNLYIQDSTGGIVVRFAQNHTFSLGSELKIQISGGALSEFNGLLQIDGINTSAVDIVGNPGDVVPRNATLMEVLNNLEIWESTLVRIENVTLSGNTVYEGEVMVSDGTGTIIMFTRSLATFAQDPIASGQLTLTGIVSQFTEPQLIIRSTSDIE